MEDIDMSWIDEEMRFLSINKDMKREKLEYIKINFCFLDRENAISKITSTKYTFSNVDDYNRIITEHDILSMIESKKNDDLKHYIFSDLLLFIVDIEPLHIDALNQSIVDGSTCSSNHFLKHYTVISDVICPPTIFIFHSINSIYILLKEKHTIKSILKKTNGNNTTRKNVKFSDNIEVDVLQTRKTRRNI